MQIFNSATKTVPTYLNSYFLFSDNTAGKVSGSYHKPFKNNLNLNLTRPKMTRTPSLPPPWSPLPPYI